MIFTGDIALPNPSAIDFTNIPKDMRLKNWIGNLEGAVVKVDNPDISAVYNHYEAIDRLISDIRFIGFTLANNHIFDSGSYEKTTSFLAKRNIKYTGIGLNVQDACKEIVFYEENAQIIIIGFGWEVIQCEIAAEDKMGVNPLERNHVLNTIKKLKLQYPEGKIVCMMHWSYELEGEPQPFERELARKIIDLGAAGVIGAHPHRVGGFEIYKGKPIVYSLGNWMFRQNHFFNGKLRFPGFCTLQLAFEWDFETDKMFFHFFEYNKIDHSISYRNTEDVTGPTMKALTPFRDMNRHQYAQWYRKNHYHRNKGLPIFYWEDSDSTIRMKNTWVKMRDKALKLILNKGK